MTDEGGFIKITGIVSKLFFDELMNGREPFHNVEWDIQEGDTDLRLIKAKAWDLLYDHFSQNTGTEDDSEEDFEMRGLMQTMLSASVVLA